MQTEQFRQFTMESRSENTTPSKNFTNFDNDTKDTKSSPTNPEIRQRRGRGLQRRNSEPDLTKFATHFENHANLRESGKRPSYILPKKEHIRSRKLSGPRTKPPRALSPINYKVKEYLARADEKIEDYLERIVQNVHDSADNAQVMVQSCVQKLQEGWKAIHFEKLPNWLKDNDHLHFGHRPELRSFAACFRSIFRIHTETGNIWTHLIGFIAFVIVTIVFYVKPLCDNCHQDIQVNLFK